MCATTSTTCPTRYTTTSTARDHLLEIRRLHSAFFGSDPILLEAALATYIANVSIATNPVWMLLVAPSSSTKSFVISLLSNLKATVTLTQLTEAGLLSATPRRDRTESATGGALRDLPDPGVILYSDMSPHLDTGRNKIDLMSAFRFIYDGKYTRNVGSDGGIRLEWKGHAGFIGGVTPVIDRAYHIRAEMGERFLLIRSHPSHAESSRSSFLALLTEDADRYPSLLEPILRIVESLPTQPVPPEQLSISSTYAISCLSRAATWLRSPVHYSDMNHMEAECIAVEQPARVGRQLRALYLAYMMMGQTPPEAWRSIQRIAFCAPVPSRTAILRLIHSEGLRSSTEIAAGTGSSYKNTQRTLAELQALGLLVESDTRKTRNAWSICEDCKRLVDMALAPDMPDVPMGEIAVTLGIDPSDLVDDFQDETDHTLESAPTSDDDDDGGGGGGGSAPSLPPDEIDPADGRSDALWEKKKAQELRSRSRKGVA